MSIEEKIQELIDKFNEKIKNDEKLQNELSGIKRSVLISLKDGNDTLNLHFVLDDMHAGDVVRENIDDPDITILSDVNSMTKLIDGELRPMKAWATGKLKVTAKNTEDIFRFRKLI